MGDAPANGSETYTEESEMYRRLQAVLRELDSPDSSTFHNKGMLRWTLHRSVQTNPWSCVLLVKVLVKELEQVERLNAKAHIIPLLHTLIYALMQATHLPDDLSLRMYELCRNLLTQPHPYSTLGLRYAGLIKTQLNTPGALYQRRVLAEHAVCTGFSSSCERVLVLADPAVFTHLLVVAVRGDLERVCVNGGALQYQLSVLQHTLQAALGEACHGGQLAEALQKLGQDIQPYFHAVVAAVASGAEKPERSTFLTEMDKIYSEILSTAQQEVPSQGLLCSCPLPNPDISFIEWSKEEQLWGTLAKFARTKSLPDQDCMDLSVLSIDDKKEANPPALTRKHGTRKRRSNSMALIWDSLQGDAGEHTQGIYQPKKPFTAHIVVMGDDRALGRLAQAYHSIRQSEARRLFLTTKLNMQMYYVPVTDAEAEGSSLCTARMAIGSYLGRLDPWYRFNIISLGDMISFMAKMQASSSGASDSDSFLVDNLAYYTRMGTQPVHLSIYSVRITFSSPAKPPKQDLFVCQLEVDVPDSKTLCPNLTEGSARFRKSVIEMSGAFLNIIYRKHLPDPGSQGIHSLSLKDHGHTVLHKHVSLSSRENDQTLSVRTSGLYVNAVPSQETEDTDCLHMVFKEACASPEPPVKTCQVIIKTLESRTFSVCLDKDPRRTFSEVQSLEIFPCIDPGFSTQENLSEDEEGSGRQQSRRLFLPINTFSGCAQ